MTLILWKISLRKLSAHRICHGHLLGGIRCRWAEAHPEDAGIPYDARIISLVVNIAAIRY